MRATAIFDLWHALFGTASFTHVCRCCRIRHGDQPAVAHPAEVATDTEIAPPSPGLPNLPRRAPRRG